MNHVVIVTGGNRDISHYREMIKSINPYVIGADDGALWLVNHAEVIHLAVGDFDTIGASGIEKLKNKSFRLIQAPIEKDETDTELALNVALDKQPEEITIYGGLGSRFDHTLANIHLLWKCMKRGIRAKVVDPWNKIQLIDRELQLTKTYAYVSLLPFTSIVKGVTLTGCKYPLINATLEWGSSIGISNEMIDGQATIQIKNGTLIVIESNDPMKKEEESI